MAIPPSKTPLNVLHDICSRRGIVPKFDLVSLKGTIHEPTFVYRVLVYKVIAIGVGHSKKMAKHAAAKAVIDSLLDQGRRLEQNGAAVATNNIIIPGNPVGELQELCMARRWPPPFYELRSEEGLPHERKFTIACTIRKRTQVGSGKSKKLAKRHAAYKMLVELRDMPADMGDVGDSDDDDEVF